MPLIEVGLFDNKNIFLKKKNKDSFIYYYFCVCAHEFMCVQKPGFLKLELELQVLVKCSVSAGTSPGPLREQSVL